MAPLPRTWGGRGPSALSQQLSGPYTLVANTASNGGCDDLLRSGHKERAQVEPFTNGDAEAREQLAASAGSTPPARALAAGMTHIPCRQNPGGSSFLACVSQRVSGGAAPASLPRRPVQNGLCRHAPPTPRGPAPVTLHPAREIRRQNGPQNLRPREPQSWPPKLPPL